MHVLLRGKRAGEKRKRDKRKKTGKRDGYGEAQKTDLTCMSQEQAFANTGRGSTYMYPQISKSDVACCTPPNMFTVWSLGRRIFSRCKSNSYNNTV